MTTIPINTYKVEADPRVEELIKKCVEHFGFEDEVFINMHPLNDFYRTSQLFVCCDGDGCEAVVREAFKHFLNAGYHCCIYNNGCCPLWAKVGRKPFNNNYSVEIVG